jgi:cell wall-associated NlpC family hydrolase
VALVDRPVALHNADRIVAAAQGWLGCPYHHASDLKGVGVDCAMLPVRVFCDLGLVPPFDPRPYPHDFMLHRDDERYRDWVKQFADQVETPQAGDLALFRIGRCYAHGAIVVDHRMIHADLRAGCVEYGDLATWCANRKHEFWRVR